MRRKMGLAVVVIMTGSLIIAEVSSAWVASAATAARRVRKNRQNSKQLQQKANPGKRSEKAEDIAAPNKAQSAGKGAPSAGKSSGSAVGAE